MQRFADGYAEKLRGRPFFENTFYAVFIVRPGMFNDVDATLRDAAELREMFYTSVNGYDIEALKIYRKGGYEFSQLYELIAYIYNGVWEPLPVNSVRLSELLPSTAHYFGMRTVESRRADGVVSHSSLYDLKAMGSPTTHGMITPLLGLPLPGALSCRSLSSMAGRRNSVLLSMIIR